MIGATVCRDTDGFPDEGKARGEEGWIAIVNDNDTDLMVVREERLPASLNTVADLLSESIPGATAVSDAVNQYGQAIIKFPEGKGFADLMNRKGDDFKGWKHFAVRGDNGGVGGGNAALRQAGLTAPAVANVVLQGAAMVVGQAYMARIDNELRGVRKGIDGIVQRLDDYYAGRLEGIAESLQEYRNEFETMGRNTKSRQAGLNDIRLIVRDLRGYLDSEIKRLQRYASSTEDDEASVRSALLEFEATMNRAVFVLAMGAVAGQLELVYMDDFSRENISRVRNRIEDQETRLNDAGNKGASALIHLAGRVKGPILEEVASHLGKEDGSVDWVPISIGSSFGLLGGIVGGVVGAVTQAGGDFARKRKRQRREELTARASSGKGGVTDITEKYLAELDILEFRYNDANALIWHGDGVSIAFIDDGSSGDVSDSFRASDNEG